MWVEVLPQPRGDTQAGFIKRPAHCRERLPTPPFLRMPLAQASLCSNRAPQSLGWAVSTPASACGFSNRRAEVSWGRRVRNAAGGDSRWAGGRFLLCGLAPAPLGSGTQSSAWTTSAESFHAPCPTGAAPLGTCRQLGLVRGWRYGWWPLATSSFLRTGKDRVGRKNTPGAASWG